MDVDTSNDKVPVGGEVDYTIRVSNRGSGPAKNLQVTVTAPEQMQVLGKYEATEATLAGQTLTFALLPALDAGKDGDVQGPRQGVKGGRSQTLAVLTSDDLTKPLPEEELTTIFGEPPPMPAPVP